MTVLDEPIDIVNSHDDPVVLVNERGEPIGQELKSAVHTATTPLHLAFSLYLFNAAGQLLLTRRALSKPTWPGVWTNSCCGHPRPGEELVDAVHRRLDTELGVEVADLHCVLPDFSYRAVDASGVVENEICPVFTGTIVHPASSSGANNSEVMVGSPIVDRTNPDEPLARVNRDEVMDWVWVDFEDAVAAMEATPFAFSPWAVSQVRQLCRPKHP